MVAAAQIGSSSQKPVKKRKRKISKHALKAQEERKKRISAEEEPQPTKTAPEVKKSKRAYIKDPREADTYLISWKKHTEGESRDWKFNKNTQSWLIRHMYETDKVSKTTFTLLLDYLHDLKGGDAKARILSDATRRCLRYKEFEKSKPESTKDSQDAGETEETASTKEDGGLDASKDKSQSDSDDDESRWKKLNDHDKRKEYKRARKVLEELRDSN